MHTNLFITIHSNSVTLGNLVRLGTLLEQEEYVTMARKTVGSFSTSFSRFPYAMPALLGSFMLMVNGIKQVCDMFTAYKT